MIMMEGNPESSRATQSRIRGIPPIFIVSRHSPEPRTLSPQPSSSSTLPHRHLHLASTVAAAFVLFLSSAASRPFVFLSSFHENLKSVKDIPHILKRRPGGYGCLDFSSPISFSLPLLCGLCSGQSWGAFELLVPLSISCLKHLELLVCSDRACDLLQGGSDWGLLSRSTSSSERWCWSLRIGWFGAAVVFDLGAVAIGSWMRLRNRLCKEYVAGVKSFMDTAKGCKDENNCVRCPCRDCQNAFFKPLSVVQAHLYEFGIAVSYDKWIFHGEEYEFVDTGGFNVGGLHMNHENETNIEDEGDDEIKHREMLKREHNTNNVDLMQQQLFPKWFESHMRQLRENGSAEASDELYSLSNGPDFRVCYYPGCVVNGVRYLVTNRDAQRTTQNSGVMVLSEHDNLEISFYGVLISIVELVYLLGHRVILFKYPYILAIQAKQVFYVDDPKLGLNWKVIEEMHHRGLWDIQEKDVVEVQYEHVFYQQNESCDTVLKVQHDNLESQLFHRDDVNADVIQDPSLHEEMMVTTQNMDHYICDENEEDETIEDYCSDETNELQSEDDSDLDHNIP
ncbi:hypothetical protein ACOSQ4_018873 [Xanthoceras sorbifolium]